MNFKDLPLAPELFQALTDMGYETPSPIQQETLPVLLTQDTDFLGLAATGTGKTAAFSLPLLQKIDAADRKPQALILCPTRELAMQVMKQVEIFSRHLDVNSVCVYGGSAYGPQIKAIKSGAQVIVGTPGRILDLIDKDILKLGDVKTLVLDEADEMVSMGFKEDLETILDQIPADKSRIWFFSATMGPKVRSVAQKYLRNPVQVQINKTDVLPGDIHQYYFIAKESHRAEILCKLVDFAEKFYGIVFCQTKQETMNLTQNLLERGYKAESLHGDKSQDAREHTLKAFRDRKLDILVCTDVAARGLDINDITHVVNYGLPRDVDSYIHRIGRTGRSGKTGIALNLIGPKGRHQIKRIENFTKVSIKEGRVPSRKEIGMKKVKAYLDAFKAAPFEKAQALLNEEWQTELQEMSGEEIASRFLSLMFADTFVSEKAERQEAFSERFDDERPQRHRDRKPRFDRSSKERRSYRNDESSDRGSDASTSSRPEGRFSKPTNKKNFGEKKSYGDKKKYSDKESYGDKKKYADKESFGDKKKYSDNESYGDKKKYADKESFGDKKKFGEKKSFGEKKKFGDKKSYGDKKNSPEKNDFEEKKTFKKTSQFDDDGAPAEKRKGKKKSKGFFEPHSRKKKAKASSQKSW